MVGKQETENRKLLDFKVSRDNPNSWVSPETAHVRREAH
jgi:hypothetical protein